MIQHKTPWAMPSLARFASLSMFVALLLASSCGGSTSPPGVDDAPTPFCGDGAADAGEACDDGNEAAGDGCDASCAVETGWACVGAPSACTTVCNDGIRTGAEACDDGVSQPDDGCDDNCAIEAGFTCNDASPSSCSVCGDGQLGGTEACDDDDTDNEDGCSDACTIEPNFQCAGTPSACYECGDGIIDPTEACDDNDTDSGDGCSNVCAIELNFQCDGAPSSCFECGNGVIDPNETCDDDGLAGGDGCSATCQVELGAGYTCNGTPSACSQCGTGIIGGTEQCDDNNLVELDGCSSTCQLEQYVTVGTGTGVLVTDNGYNGFLATMKCQAIDVTNVETVGTVNHIDVAAVSTWVGDITLKLVSPQGTVMTVMSRPGAADILPEGSDTPAGDSTNWQGTPVRFINSAVNSAEAMGSVTALSTSQFVCTDDGICEFSPDDGPTDTGGYEIFAGEPGNGRWRLCIGDSAVQDSVGIVSWMLNITAAVTTL